MFSPNVHVARHYPVPIQCFACVTVHFLWWGDRNVVSVDGCRRLGVWWCSPFRPFWLFYDRVMFGRRHDFSTFCNFSISIWVGWRRGQGGGETNETNKKLESIEFKIKIDGNCVVKWVKWKIFELVSTAIELFKTILKPSNKPVDMKILIR